MRGVSCPGVLRPSEEKSARRLSHCLWWDGVVAKNFGAEGLDHRAVLPRVAGEAGFAAGLFEKGHAVPVMLDRNLGQKQSATAALADEQAVAADLNGLGRNRLGWSENAEFDLEVRSFRERDRRKPVVLERRGPRRLAHGAIDRSRRKHVADASPELAVEMQRREHAARLRQMGGGRVERNLVSRERRLDRLVRQAQQLRSFLLGKFVS